MKVRHPISSSMIVAVSMCANVPLAENREEICDKMYQRLACFNQRVLSAKIWSPNLRDCLE